MDLQYIIKAFKKAQEDIEETINTLKFSYQNESQLWSQLDKLDVSLLINEKLINFLADSMQMVNDEERLKSFDLLDIKGIYELLIQYYPSDIQYRIDLISFVYNVLDDENEASILINNTMSMIDDKRAELTAFCSRYRL